MMKKAIIILFGLLIITGNPTSFGLKFYTSPMEIVQATASATWSQRRRIPVYAPGSVKLAEVDLTLGVFAMYPFMPTKRHIYYGLPHWLEELAPDNGSAFVDKLEAEKDGSEPEEMVAVSFVKYYNIARADFKKAEKKALQFNKKMEDDSCSEAYEVPNADIIYTFNNMLIDYYYRRA